MDDERIKDNILKSIISEEKVSLIKEFKSAEKENETLFFLKPEFFNIEDKHSMEAVLYLILKKIKEYNMDIDGIATLKGEFLKQAKIIERHYGFINKYSTNGSNIVNDCDKEKIKKALSLETLEGYNILGGHEVISSFDNINESLLTEMWYGGHASRIGEGFYIQVHKINDENIILINGFHPSQIEHYTKKESKIVLFILNTDTDWKIVRDDFVGDTFPEKAKKSSIRAILYKNYSKIGIKKINVAYNYVHTSSGPFDALFEICNFVGDIEGINYCKYNTNIYNRMVSNFGLSKDDYEKCIENPRVKIDGHRIDLFSFTKNKNTSDAIADYIKYFK